MHQISVYIIAEWEELKNLQIRTALDFAFIEGYQVPLMWDRTSLQ